MKGKYIKSYLKLKQSLICTYTNNLHLQFSHKNTVQYINFLLQIIVIQLQKKL